MDWLKHGASWPHREHSKFVVCDQTRWHMQKMGDGPDLLLLHGSGATTHSYAGLMPLLAKEFTVTAIDLPGHGFSSPLGSGQPTLKRVGEAVAALMQQEAMQPELIVGHSAGAAIAVQMVAKCGLTPEKLVSINGAFYPFPGLAGSVFPMAAKLLFLNPFVPKLFSFSADYFGRVESLIDATGSKLSREGLSFYEKAMSSSDHVEGALALMAHWDLEPMASQIAALDIPMLQIIGLADGTISPNAARDTQRLLKHGSRKDFVGKGHLVHEESPEDVAETILEFSLANS